nr:T9SS type A sorting domain-containing protein [uncultured Flavobacterium sp.]
MKRTLLLVLVMTTFLSAHAQTKSTGVVALAVSGMTAKLDLNNTTTTATLTLTGPSDRWFALQFGSFASGDGMQAGEDVVYYNGTTLIDAVHNGVGSAPSADTNNWTVTSNTVAAGTRTIIATRAFNTGNANDYTFVYANPSIDFACAKMSSATFSLAYHGGGNRGYSIDVPLTTVLGVDAFEQSKIAFYPNPASSVFSIQSDAEIQSVRIYDTTGKQLIVFKNRKELLDISGLPNGIYFVEIENSDNTVLIEKLIKK